MKKRVLTLALVLAMCLSLAIPAFAADESTKDPDPETTASQPADKTDDEAAEPSKPADPDAEPSESADPDAKPSESADPDAKPSESADPDAKPSESADPDAKPSESADPDAEPSKDPAPALEFTDVPEGIWYDEPVKWAVEQKITNGTEDTKFSPSLNCSQIQILTFLYRAAQAAENPDFAPTADDLQAAAAWAKEKGMIDETFENSKDCTRATAASYIWQAFGSKEVEANDAITDVAEADLAAVTWMLAQKITNGTSEDPFIFSPDQVCSRAEIVTFLYRAYNPVQPDAPADPAPAESTPAESAE